MVVRTQYNSSLRIRKNSWLICRFRSRSAGVSVFAGRLRLVGVRAGARVTEGGGVEYARGEDGEVDARREEDDEEVGVRGEDGEVDVRREEDDGDADARGEEGDEERLRFALDLRSSW